jgi:hypothetical protein
MKNYQLLVSLMLIGLALFCGLMEIDSEKNNSINNNSYGY